MSEQQVSAPALVAQIIDGLDPGSFVTRFVLVAEAIDPDTGKRGIWTETHEDATRWDIYGLLHEALTAEQAGQIRAHLDDEDE